MNDEAAVDDIETAGAQAPPELETPGDWSSSDATTASGVGAAGRPLWRSARTAAVLAAPWSWFVVRDIGGRVDFVAITLPLLAVMACLIGVTMSALWRSSRPALGALSTAAMCLTAVIGPWTPQAGVAPVEGMTIVSANIAARRSDAVIASLQAQTPDVLVVTELPEDVHERLAAAYPHSLVTPVVFEAKGATVTGTTLNRAAVGVYSTYPLEQLDDPTRLVEGLPGLRARVETASGPVVLYALHLPKPSPIDDGFSASFAGQALVAERVRQAARAETIPVVLAGDFNISDRQVLYRHFSSTFTDAMRHRWAAATSAKSSLLWLAMQLRVDHIFHADTLCSTNARRFLVPGADHLGLSTRIGRCPE